MTKKIVLSAIAASVMASSAMATYGSNLISFGTKTKAMAGTGVATANGAQSAFMNPAMMAGADQEITANVTMMDIDVTATNGNTTGYKSSATDSSIVPTIAYIKPINKDLSVGVTVSGAGMGVDHKASATLTKMYTNLEIMKVGIPVAYNVNKELAVSITPVYADGSLQMSTVTGSGAGQSPDNTASDTAFGYEVGVAYKVDGNLNVGFVYKSPIEMEYKSVITSAAAAFGGVTGITDKLEQAGEMALGVSYKMGKSTINVDYRSIAWSSTKGYGDFGWDDQTIIALGYEFNGGSWKARAGYSSGNSPLVDLPATTDNDKKDALNALGFPATPATHMTFGGAYDVNKQLTVEAAVVLAASDDYSANASLAGQGTVGATNDQTNITLGVNYKF